MKMQWRISIDFIIFYIYNVLMINNLFYKTWKIDTKRRIVIPSDFLDIVQQSEHLYLVNKSTSESLSLALVSTDNISTFVHDNFWYMSDMYRSNDILSLFIQKTKLDSVHRILLPQSLYTEQQEVAIYPSLDEKYINIVDMQEFEQLKSEIDSLRSWIKK